MMSGECHQLDVQSVVARIMETYLNFCGVLLNFIPVIGGSSSSCRGGPRM